MREPKGQERSPATPQGHSWCPRRGGLRVSSLLSETTKPQSCGRGPRPSVSSRERRRRILGFLPENVPGRAHRRVAGRGGKGKQESERKLPAGGPSCPEPPPAHPPPGSRIPGGLRAPAATRHGLPTAQEAAEDPSPFGSDGEIATVIRPTDRSGMCFFPHFPVSSFAPNLKTHRCLKAPTKCAPGLFCPPSKGPPQTSRVEQAPSSVADGLRGHVRDQTQREGPGGAGPRLPPRPLSPVFSRSRLKRPDVVYGRCELHPPTPIRLQGLVPKCKAQICILVPSAAPGPGHCDSR